MPNSKKTRYETLCTAMSEAAPYLAILAHLVFASTDLKCIPSKKLMTASIGNALNKNTLSLVLSTFIVLVTMCRSYNYYKLGLSTKHYSDRLMIFHQASNILTILITFALSFCTALTQWALLFDYNAFKKTFETASELSLNNNLAGILCNIANAIILIVHLIRIADTLCHCFTTPQQQSDNNEALLPAPANS